MPKVAEATGPEKLASAIDDFGLADMLGLRRVTFNGVTLGDNLDDREFEDRI